MRIPDMYLERKPSRPAKRKAAPKKKAAKRPAKRKAAKRKK
jgi:hypothetical protein